MKLHFAGPSPFVRMVRVTAHEAGLADRIELVGTGPFVPIEPHERVIADNPLGKLPALVLDDGSSLFDSRVICEWLVSEGNNDELLPAEGPQRWRVLRLQALGQGLCDAGVAYRYETALRPPELQWDKWIAGQYGKIERAISALGDSPDDLAGADLGTIAAAVALSYLDFRFEDLDWRAGRGVLADWYAQFAERPSMKENELSLQM